MYSTGVKSKQLSQEELNTIGGLTATNLLYTLSILPHPPPPFQFLAPITGSVREELFTFDPNEIFSKPV